MIFLSLFFLLMVFSPRLAFPVTSFVKLTEGGTPIQRNTLSQRLSTIVNSFDDKNWDVIQNFCTPAGFTALIELVEKTGCRNVNPLYETKLLELANGNYEVRDIKVKVKMRGTKGNPYQFMVFTINRASLVSDVRFAMELTRYNEIINQGQLIEDFVYRQPLLQFLEFFRTAYNRKDLEYLKKVYSDDALIIVGKVLQEKPDSPDYLERSALSRERIQFIKLNKHRYIERLENIFQKNAFVKVRFDSIDIKRSPMDSLIYGAMLKQYWSSSKYSDEGYLFLMLDFHDLNNPVIHVRSWQPERFSDGSVVNLGDFIVIPGTKE